MKNLPLKAILLAVFCNILFGSATPFIKLGYASYGISGDAFSAILYAGIRFFVSGIIVFIIDMIMTRKIPTVPKGNRANVLLTALTYTFLQYLFFYIGLSHTTGASATIINSSSVFIAVVLAHFIYPDDKINLRKILGCICGFAGVLIACFAGGKIGGFSFFGEGFVLLTALFFVIGSVFNKKATKESSSFTVTAYNLLVGGALMILVGLIGGAQITPTVKGTFILAYLIFVSAVGFTLWSSLLRKYPIGKLSVFNFIIPVAGTLLSGLFLKENIFTLQYLFATIAVVAGILILNLKYKKQG